MQSKKTSKKTEAIETSSAKRHRKSSGTTAPGAETSAAKPISDTPAHEIKHTDIAELAHSYWVARGHSHGSAEEDWRRAERELSGRS